MYLYVLRMEESMVKKLYQYTTLESLALILKSKNIRLNPLTNLDDLQEMQSQDEINYGRFVFISSWMDQPKESIAMWKLYSNMYSGVRIGLQEYPFKKYFVTSEKVKEYFASINLSGVGVTGESTELILPVEKCYNKEYLLLNPIYDDVLESVQYTDDESLINPRLIEGEKNGFSMSTKKLGKYKNTYWEFQREKRYILRFVPGDFSIMMSSGKVAEYIYNKLQNEFFSHFDLAISNEAFESIEITMAPQFTEGNRVLLRTLCEKYNPSAKIIESELKDRINAK